MVNDEHQEKNRRKTKFEKNPKVHIVEVDEPSTTIDIEYDALDGDEGVSETIKNQSDYADSIERPTEILETSDKAEDDLDEEIEAFSQKFSSIAQIGEGGMSRVYKAFDPKRNQMVALKVVRRELARDPGVVERFEREVRMAQKVSHPGIAQLYEIDKITVNDQELPFLVMELVDGKSLADIIAESGHLEPKRALAIFIQICDTLNEAHKTGLVHRDIKPSNVIITREEDGQERAKLVDFGIAKPSATDRAINPSLTHTGSILGSPAYMSPEQCMGQGVDERSDIYSFGCLMYECLTGRSPFAAATPVKTIVRHLEEKAEPFDIEFKDLKIPKSLEIIVLRCLEKSPTDRYQRCWLLMKALTSPPAPGFIARCAAELLDNAILLHIFYIITEANSYAYVSFGIVFLYLIPFYIALCHSSRWQATPFQRLIGIKVYGEDGRRLSYIEALCATGIIYYGVNTVFCLGTAFLFLYFPLKGHTSMASSWFVLAYPLFIFASILTGAFNHGLQYWQDKLLGRVVAKPFILINSPRVNSKKPDASLGKIMLLTILALMPFAIYISTYLTFIYEPTKVIVARETIHEGTVITEDMLSDAGTFPILARGKQIKKREDLIGKRTLETIWNFEAIHPDEIEIPPQ